MTLLLSLLYTIADRSVSLPPSRILFPKIAKIRATVPHTSLQVLWNIPRDIATGATQKSQNWASPRSMAMRYLYLGVA